MHNLAWDPGNHLKCIFATIRKYELCNNTVKMLDFLIRFFIVVRQDNILLRKYTFKYSGIKTYKIYNLK